MGATHTITFVTAEGDRTPVKTEPGTSFLDAAREAEIDVTATCGARGKCRGCRFKVLKGSVPPPTIMDEVQLGPDEVHEGFRLACQTHVIADTEIMLAPPQAEIGHQILGAGENRSQRTSIEVDSGIEKKFVTAAIPVDEHIQSSDIEEILTATGASQSGSLSPDLLRKLPAVLREKKGAVTVTTFNGDILDIEAGDTTEHKYGMAFDIGTTSIVGGLLDLDSGEQLASVGDINPQSVYGGDLMSRLAFAQFDLTNLRKLRVRAVQAINDQIKEACEKAAVSPEHIYKVVVVGNTAMHHIFLGIDPTYVGMAPYSPSIRNAIEMPARDLLLKTIPNATVCMLPIVAGFVGADAMGAVLATRIFESEEIRVLIDIGTNGEVIMGRKGRLMACSAPAGPALEGAQIKHGMRGAIGAIEKVQIGDDVTCETIGNAPAAGICGSGLIDATASLLKSGILQSSGRFVDKDDKNLPSALAARLSDSRGERGFILVYAEDSSNDTDITLTQLDIRQLQLAKGAIYSGVLMLQQIMEVPDDEIAELMLAGGFGNYINTKSAVAINLLPSLPLEIITYVGNAALMGAQMALISEFERKRADVIAKEIEHVSLGARAEFQEVFIEAMCFPEDKADDPMAKTGT
ncbi:MAG: ASKHA domain-containing protein [Rhodospirillales bacterium]